MLAKDYVYHTHTSLHCCTFVLRHKDLLFLKAAYACCQHGIAQLSGCACHHTKVCTSLVATLHTVLGKVYPVQLLGCYCMTVSRFVTCYRATKRQLGCSKMVSEHSISRCKRPNELSNAFARTGVTASEYHLSL